MFRRHGQQNDKNGRDEKDCDAPETSGASTAHPERAPGGVYHTRDIAMDLGKRMAVLLLTDVAITPPTPQLIGVISAAAMRAYFEGAGKSELATLEHPLGKLFGETFNAACVDAIFDALGDEVDRYGLN